MESLWTRRELCVLTMVPGQCRMVCAPSHIDRCCARERLRIWCHAQVLRCSSAGRWLDGETVGAEGKCLKTPVFIGLQASTDKRRCGSHLSGMPRCCPTHGNDMNIHLPFGCNPPGLSDPIKNGRWRDRPATCSTRIEPLLKLGNALESSHCRRVTETCCDSRKGKHGV